MKQFPAKFIVNNKPSIFLFTHLYTVNGEIFFVNASREEEIDSFHMKKTENDGWKLHGPAPNWIMEIESRLSEIIKENFRAH